MTDTAELERLAASITPGPWRKHGNGSQVVSEGALIASLPYAAVSKPNARAIALVPDLLAEVIALRAEVERLRCVLRKRSEEADSYEERSHVAEARATAAEADAERLAEALDAMGDVCNCSLGDAALAAHTQRVNAKEYTQ